jgi:DNA-binding transcriptional LysR family regulator
MPRSTYQQQRADGDGYHQEADMSVSLDLLRTFLAVYRHGSITAAAERVGLSQPAMTAQVKSLETRLDRQLLVRQARGMAPTPAADDLARAVAGPLDSLARAVDDDTDPFARAVLLGGPAELLTEVALPLLAPLVGEGLRLRVSFGLADDLLNALSRRGVRAEPAYDESFVLVGAPGQSTDAPMIAYAEDLPIIRRYWRLVYGMRPPMSAQVVVPDLRAVLTLVLRGAGISVLPSYLCTTHLDAGRLVPLARPDLAPINTGYVAWRHGALTHPAVAAVHAHLLERLRQM